jgi:hypothetical protein
VAFADSYQFLKSRHNGFFRFFTIFGGSANVCISFTKTACGGRFHVTRFLGRIVDDLSAGIVPASGVL